MRMTYATGRYSRVKHATGADIENRKPRKGVRGVGHATGGSIRHSTGRDSRVLHSTGAEFDLATEDEELVLTKEEELVLTAAELIRKRKETMMEDTERELVEVGVDR